MKSALTRLALQATPCLFAVGAALMPLTTHASVVLASQPVSSTAIITSTNNPRVATGTSGLVSDFSTDIAGVSGFPGSDAVFTLSCYTDAAATSPCAAPNTWTLTIPEASFTFDGVERTESAVITGGALLFDAAQYYVFTARPNNHFTQYGTSTGSYSLNYTFSGAASPSSVIDWFSIYFPAVYDPNAGAIASSSSLWGSIAGSTTLSVIVEQCSTSGNIFSYAICRTFAYLFTPGADALNEMAGVPALAATKFPFSWVAGMKDIYDGLTASSTENFIGLRLNLSTVDMASSTAFGRILPDVTLFGTSTVSRYIPDGFRQGWLYIIGLGLWLTLATDIFYGVRNRWHKTS